MNRTERKRLSAAVADEVNELLRDMEACDSTAPQTARGCYFLKRIATVAETHFGGQPGPSLIAAGCDLLVETISRAEAARHLREAADALERTPGVVA